MRGGARLRSVLSHHPRLWIAAGLLGGLAVLFWLWMARAWWPVPSLQAWHHLRLARAELARYHNPQAIRHIQVCLRVWPNDPDVLLLAARATRRERKYAETERLLEKYKKIRGLDDAGSFEQLLLTAERHVEKVADQCWRYVEQGHPDTPLLLEALARGYMHQYRLTEARACLNRWLESEPDNAQAHFLEGLLILDYFHARSAAEQSYRRAVELDPEHEPARLGLAVILVDTKNFAEAAEHLEYVKTHQPDNLAVLVGLAECRAGLGDEGEAAKLLDEVLAQFPNYPPALTLHGRLAQERGDYEAAERYLRQAVALNPSDRRGRSNLIGCLNALGQQAEAQREREELEQRDKDLERFDEIITKVLPQHPRDPALHCELGRLLLRGNFYEEGLRWLNSALLIDPNYGPAQEALNEYYKKAKARGH